MSSPENFRQIEKLSSAQNPDQSVKIFLAGKSHTPFESSSGENIQKPEHSLSQEEKDKIKAETDWSDEIVNAISSMEEYEIYKNAGLIEAEINGKKCLIKADLDMNQVDDAGRTNKERMEMGLAPIDKSGETIELHHIGQKSDGPLAELTTSEHRSKGNDTVLHDKSKESEIDRVAFTKERNAHWEERATA